MANGYLGKISAVVSANTADFQSKLNAAAKDVQKFASSMQGSLSSAQSSSSSALRGIYTEAQKLERALAAISTRKLSFRGFADKDIDTAVGRMKALYSATEQINKPLASAAKAFGKLPAEIQGAFLPALISSQKAAESLADEINRTGKVSEQRFDAVAAKIDRTTAAMSRLKEASSLVSGLATGRELAFQRPEMVAETRRSASLQADIGKLPAADIGGYAELVAQQRAAAVETERLAAALEKAKLSRNADVASATAAYQSQLAAQRQLNDAIERRVGAQEAAAKRAAAAADAEIAILQRRAQAEKVAEQERQAAAKRSGDAEIAVLQRRAQAQKAAETERQAQTQKAADAEIAVLQRVQQAAKAAELERQAQAQKVADAEIANLQRVQQAARAAEQERLAQAQKVADNEIAVLQRRAQAEKTAELERQAQAQRTVDAEIAILQRRAQAEKAAELERQSQSQKSADSEIANLQRVQQAAKAAEQERLAQAQKAADNEIALLIRREQAAKAAALGGPRGAQSAAFRQSFGGNGADGVNLGLDQRALQGYNAQLQILQSAIGRASTEARGPAVAAFERLRAAVATAFDEGTIDSVAMRQQLASVRAEAIAAAAAAGGIGVRGLTRDVDRAGDVGRGGFDKFSLALNQAAFAVDDFMSSTGGLEFKLRAVSNNITQLAFILGGTTGLFVGLGAVIAGQAAVGLVKWANNGRSAEDQTKALNDALARQKSLVEDLAQAFRSLGDAMTRGTFSAGGEQASEFSKQMEDIRKKQIESRRERVAGFDADVQRERGEQNKLNKELEAATDPGQRVALAAAIEASKQRERAAADSAAERASAGASPDDVLRAVQATIRPTEFLEGGRLTDRSKRMAEARQTQAENDVRGARGDVIKLEKVLRNRLDERREVAARPLGVMNFEENPEIMRAREDVAALEATIATLQDPLRAAIDIAANEIAESSRGPATRIRQAQEDVAEAIRRGVPNAAAFQRELDANAKKLKDAYSSLEEAQNETDVDKKKAKVDDAQRNITAVEAEQEKIRTRSREMRLGRTFGGERTASALSSLEGNDRFRNESARTTALLKATIDRELEARRRLEEATAKGVDAEIEAAEAGLEAAQKASEAAAAFAEAALAIESALTRIRKVGESALQKSEQGADAAQKAFEENPQRAGGRENREAAERRLIDDRARVADAQDSLDNRRRQIQNDPRMSAISDELEQVTQRRKDLEAKAAIEGNQFVNQGELDAARKREIELTRQREHLARDLTAAEREQLDAINNGIAAREKELEKSRQRAAEDPTFKRRMDAANQVIANSERQANEAQERYINNPTAQNRKERDEADFQLRIDRKRAQELQDNLDNKRRELERNPDIVRNNKAIAINDKRLAELAEKEATVGLTDEEKLERERLQEDNRRARRDNEIRISAGTVNEQNAVDDELRAQNQRDRARRGRDLGLTDRERFRKEFEEGAGAEINARAKELKDKGENPAAFLRQAISNQLESAAPMLKQLQMDRETALLQGPSRAALSVSDVSTSQGQSELNRLLRGDDSAKDVNLAELRKQTEKFDELIKTIKDANPGVLL